MKSSVLELFKTLSIGNEDVSYEANKMRAEFNLPLSAKEDYERLSNEGLIEVQSTHESEDHYGLVYELTKYGRRVSETLFPQKMVIEELI